MERQQCNKQILEHLATYIDNNPDIRFSQALYNLRIVESSEEGYTWRDTYNEEPAKTLDRVSLQIQRIGRH